MGQYYRAVNIDKREIMEFDGAKLMEFAWVYNRSMRAFMALMNGAWQGDRVYIVGDYADLDERSFHEGDDAWLHVLEAAERELGFHGKTFVSESGRTYPDYLYGFAERNFKDVTEDAMKLVEDGAQLRYILNAELGVYIDLEHCPADSIFYYAEDDKVYVYRVHPLAIILAMGNGRGGGDFRQGVCKPFVDLHADRRTVKRVTSHPFGAWCDTSSAIRFAKAGEEAELEGLQEWDPYFAENETPTPWQEIEAKVAEVLAKGREKK